MLTFNGQTLGEFTASQYSCGYQGVFYVCYTNNATTKAAFVELQKATDAMINSVPLWRPNEAIVPSPIGSSKAGYDGVIGPETSGEVQAAVIAAMQLRRDAGESDESFPLAAVSVARVPLEATKTYKVQRTELCAKYATEITQFLRDTVASFDDLMSRIRAREAAAVQSGFKWVSSIFSRPPPLPVPSDVKTRRTVKRFKPVGLAVMGAAVAAALGFASYKGYQAYTAKIRFSR